MTITSRFEITTTSISASTLIRGEAARRYLQITRPRAIVRDGRHATASIGRRKVRGVFGKGSGRTALVAAVMLGVGAAEASATPLTPFRYEAQAQRHCPHDQVVWLDFRKGVYYGRGQKLYGQGFDGSFVCRSEARDSFYRRSLLGLR